MVLDKNVCLAKCVTLNYKAKRICKDVYQTSFKNNQNTKRREQTSESYMDSIEVNIRLG